MEQSPGHGADIVKEPEDGGGSIIADGTRPNEEAEMGIDFFG